MPDSNATITRTQLIERAFRRIGIGSPQTSEVALAIALLNDICKELDTEGRWLWTISNTPSSLTLIAAQASYGAGSGASLIPLYMIGLERLELQVGSVPYLPLTLLSRDDWFRSPLRATSGQPLEAYFDAKASSSNSLLWLAPTPDAAYTANLFYRRRLYDFDNASDNPDFPADWNQRLVKRLAQELAPEYGIPLQERLKIESEVKQAMDAAAASNSEPATKKRAKVEYC